MKKLEQVWSDEAGIQVRFERDDQNRVVITRIMKAENGHEYLDEENRISIRGWRWDRVCEVMGKQDEEKR